MLPSAPKSLGRLGEVLISALHSVQGKSNSLALPARKSVCVILIDGLGVSNIKSAAGHASFLNSQHSEPAMCWFPATTATSITSFATASNPWDNGFLGYQVFDRKENVPRNLLSGWANQAEGEKYQSIRTVSELGIEQGIGFHVVAPSAYEKSGFTAATMRAASFHGTDRISQRFTKALELLKDSDEKVVYLYIPELDQLAHAQGSASIAWLNQVEDVDSELRSFVSAVPKSSGVLLTADHGVVDVPKENHIYIDEIIDGADLEFVGGDTRSLFLYFKQGTNQETMRTKLEKQFSDSCYISTPAEIVEAGYWKTLSPKSENVAPDLVILARKKVALYHRGFAKTKSLEMVGHHGSITNEELAIPLIRFGF
jgi:predicted AlkP superfamily pyrophosphatase or phosphodiesterase